MCRSMFEWKLAASAWMFTVTLMNTSFAQVQVPPKQNAVQMWLLRGQPLDGYQFSLLTIGDKILKEVRQTLDSGQQPLTEQQEARLKLALDGVVSRFTQEVGQLDAMVGDINLNDQQEQRKAIQVLQPAMQRAQQGWYGKDFFDKVCQQTLSPGQRDLLATRRREKLEQQHRVLALRMVAEIDNVILFTQSQRERLVELMNSQDTSKVPENLNSYVGYIKIVRIPSDQLEEFLDKDQCKQLNAIVDPYRQWERNMR